MAPRSKLTKEKEDERTRGRPQTEYTQLYGEQELHDRYQEPKKNKQKEENSHAQKQKHTIFNGGNENKKQVLETSRRHVKIRIRLVKLETVKATAISYTNRPASFGLILVPRNRLLFDVDKKNNARNWGTRFIIN